MLKCEVVSDKSADIYNVKIATEGSTLDISVDVLRVIRAIYGGLNESAAEEFQQHIRIGTHILSPVWERDDG